MNEILGKTETRGRPRKNTEEKLPPISRKLFSQHCAVFYACCMVYVLEVFLKTKQEKRIGHSEGGFTIYEKCSVVYCFQTFEEDVKEWGYGDVILTHRDLNDFVRTANGCAPKFVFRELVLLFMHIHQIIEESGIRTIQDLEANQTKILNYSELDLNKMFKYIRFTLPALKELKMDKWSLQISKKIRQLWRPFVKIISYTIFCVEKGIETNKYLKPFFSDAEHPEQTIIGQLNLQQIVDDKDEREDRDDKEDKEDKEDKVLNTSGSLGFTKIYKNEEEPTDKVRLFDNCESKSLKERAAPVLNRRPITLITFPSNRTLEVGSPTKLASTNPGVRSFSQFGEFDQFSPVKKVKEE